MTMENVHLTWSHLHDVVPLRVLVKVGLCELKGVVEGPGSGQPHLAACLVPPHAVDDGSQNLIGGLLEEPVLHVLAHVSDGLERALFGHLGAGGVGHVAHQGGDEARPTAPGYLDHSDHVDTLGGGAGPEALRAQGAHHVLLGVHPDILWNVEPPILVLRPQGLVIGVQEVLKLDSSLLAAHSAVTAMVQNV